MSTSNFVGEQAPFYEAILARNTIGGMSGADLSAIMSEIRGLYNLVGQLRDTVEQLAKENSRLKEQNDYLEKRIKALEKRN